VDPLLPLSLGAFLGLGPGFSNTLLARIGLILGAGGSGSEGMADADVASSPASSGVAKKLDSDKLSLHALVLRVDLGMVGKQGLWLDNYKHFIV